MIRLEKLEIDLDNWNKLSDKLPERDGTYRVLSYDEHPAYFRCCFLRYELKKWYHTYNVSISPYELKTLPVYWQNEDSDVY